MMFAEHNPSSPSARYWGYGSVLLFWVLVSGIWISADAIIACDRTIVLSVTRLVSPRHSRSAYAESSWHSSPPHVSDLPICEALDQEPSSIQVPPVSVWVVDGDEMRPSEGPRLVTGCRASNWPLPASKNGDVRSQLVHFTNHEQSDI
jgi:hypothetical protein